MRSDYSAYSYWSPLLGEHAVRLSLFDQHGREFFAIVENPGGQGGAEFRKRREAALNRIDVAMSAGRDPGEVVEENHE